MCLCAPCAPSSDSGPLLVPNLTRGPLLQARTSPAHPWTCKHGFTWSFGSCVVEAGLYSEHAQLRSRLLSLACNHTHSSPSSVSCGCTSQAVQELVPNLFRGQYAYETTCRVR